MRRLFGMVHIFVLITSLVSCVMQASIKTAHGLNLRRLVDGRDSVICQTIFKYLRQWEKSDKSIEDMKSPEKLNIKINISGGSSN